MSKHLSGGLYASSHTTALELAHELLPFFEKCNSAKRVILGVIESGKGQTGGVRSVKITMDLGQITLKFRQSRSSQSVYVYTESAQADGVAFARHIRNRGVELRFGKHWTRRI